MVRSSWILQMEVDESCDKKLSRRRCDEELSRRRTKRESDDDGKNDEEVEEDVLSFVINACLVEVPNLVHIMLVTTLYWNSTIKSIGRLCK